MEILYFLVGWDLRKKWFVFPVARVDTSRVCDVQIERKSKECVEVANGCHLVSLVTTM